MDKITEVRQLWQFYRDRRPDAHADLVRPQRPATNGESHVTERQDEAMGFLKRMFAGTPAEQPHDDPELEEQLPAAVAGRPLVRWSVRGERAFTVGGRSLSPRDLAGLEGDLGAMGLALGDVSKAVAGRAAASDPPFLIQAWQFGNRPATEMPLDMTVDVKGLGGWQRGTLGGQAVARGTVGMIQQTSHVRGRPYVCRSGHVQFSIATDDEGWAEEVCRLLPAPADPSLADPRAAIDQALEELARGEGTFAIFEVPGGRNVYAQVHVGTTVAEPWNGEVVGNEYLDKAERLDEAAQRRLVAAGWTPNLSGSGNFGREWPAWAAGSDRSSVTRDILDALEVFGSRPETLWIAVSAD